MFNIIEKRKVFFAISLVIILIGMIFMIIRGFNQDVDFIGGTALHIRIGQQFDNSEINSIIEESIGSAPSSVQKSGDNQEEVIIKMKKLTLEDRDKVFEGLSEKYDLNKESDLLSIDDVDPTIGKELKQQALVASLIASILMLIYISFRFEFKSGVAAVIALIHDVLIMLAVYSIFKVPINSSFIAAILTILGYSINDTIVIFDRIRENNKYARKETFSNIANKSIWQSAGRTVNTSLTTLITIVTLYILGVPSIKEFAFPLIVGIIAGTYSSVFIASSIWAMWYDWGINKRTKKA